MALGSFSIDISKFVKKAPDKVNEMVRKIVFDIYRNVVMRTPVDTGRARANWQIDIDRMPTEILDKTAQSLQEAIRLSDAANIITSKIKNNSVIYIINNVEYIIPLEHGHSKEQAPYGMVKLTVEEFQQYFKEASRSLK